VQVVFRSVVVEIDLGIHRRGTLVTSRRCNATVAAGLAGGIRPHCAISLTATDAAGLPDGKANSIQGREQGGSRRVPRRLLLRCAIGAGAITAAPFINRHALGDVIRLRLARVAYLSASTQEAFDAFVSRLKSASGNTIDVSLDIPIPRHCARHSVVN